MSMITDTGLDDGEKSGWGSLEMRRTKWPTASSITN